MDMAGGAGFVHFDIHHAFGYNAAAAVAVSARILDGMFQIEHDPRFKAKIALIHQHGAAFQQVAVALQRQVDDGIEQGVAWTNEGGQRLPLGSDERFLEGDALIAGQHRFADADQPVAVAYLGGYVGNLEAAGFFLSGVAAQALEGFEEEGFDVVRLQPCLLYTSI